MDSFANGAGLGVSVGRKIALIIFYNSSCFGPLNIKLIRGF